MYSKWVGGTEGGWVVELVLKIRVDRWWARVTGRQIDGREGREGF